MATSQWHGKLVIGDSVVIPVAAYSTTVKKQIGLNNTSGCHGALVKQNYTCSECGEKVDKDTMGKCFQLNKEKIPVDVEKLKTLQSNEKTDRLTLRIGKEEDLLDSRLLTDKCYEIAVDEEFNEKTNQRVEDPTARQAYRILYEGLKANGAVGIGEMTMKSDARTMPVIVRAQNKKLYMTGLHYAEQIKPSEIEEYKTPIDETDKKAGKEFIAAKMENINIGDYKDTYVEQLQGLIAGKPIIAAKVKPIPAAKPNARSMFI